MIRMLPEGFFFDMVIRIGSIFIGMLAILLILSMLILHRQKANKKNLISELRYINYTNDAKCGRIRVVAKMELQMEDNMNSVKRVYVENETRIRSTGKRVETELKAIWEFRRWKMYVC